MAILCDSYSESNQNTNTLIGSSRLHTGQSFTADGNILNSAKIYVKKYPDGTPTGNFYVKIYAHSGTYGTTSIPTGDPLATSDAISVSVLTDSYQLIEATFSGANKITLSEQYYILAVYYADNTTTNGIDVGADNSSPTHDGNWYYKIGTNDPSPNSSIDTIFYVYTEIAPVEKTITSKARIFNTISETISSKARIHNTIKQTLSSKARIQISSNKTISTQLRIKTENTENITSQTRVKNQGTQSFSSKSRIQTLNNKNISSQSRIKINNTKSITSQSRIKTENSELLTSKSRIEVLQTKSVSAKARIKNLFTQSISSQSRIKKYNLLIYPVNLG